MPLYTIETSGELKPELDQEWLLTNGLGGFASSTVVGCNTRRYHGLLVAATLPPVGRVMVVNRIGESLRFDGDERLREFSVNQFAEGFHPHGEQYLRRFDLWDTARWEYDVDGVRIVKEVQLLWMKNVAAVRYTVEPPRGKKVELGLQPFVSLRDFHHSRRAGDIRFDIKAGADGRSVHVDYETMAAYLWSDAGRFTENPDWWYSHKYAIETDRGLDDTEDLFAPGQFKLEAFGTPATITLWFALDPGAYDWDAELA